ncbi:MAG: succinylglutamate desuccinylase/aspartoacylase family protein [Limisphaerales bacterium]
MQRLGRNTNGYFGETLAIDEVLDQTLADARRLDWTVTHLDAGPGLRLAVLTRPPRIVSNRSPRIYVSAGIHGDEPAGPLAVRRLVAEDALPRDAWVWLCPCLNPTGFRRNTRETIDGLDLNRDYREPRSPEVRTHVAWLDSLPDFDLTVCLHEDWEAAGFYLYELNPENRPSLAPPTL